jgi:hypothetical protein
MSKVSVVKSVRSRKFLAALSVLVSVASMLMGARIASADEVWVQSYERTSASEVCGAQPGETPWQASWGPDSSWIPSWEQWANAGKGGWTCTRSITWARTPVAGGTSTRTYELGETGPGGGLVFLISGGLTYEMAPNTWSAGGVNETTPIQWCDDVSSDITGAVGTVVGTGSANTTAMQPTACDSGAGVSARAFTGGGYSDWFLPSKDELNAMCNYSRNPTAPAAPSVSCYGDAGSTQDTTFASGTYGFASNKYWSSSQTSGGYFDYAWYRFLGNGSQSDESWNDTMFVRPVRAF